MVAAVAMRRPASGPSEHDSKMLLAIRCVAPGKAVLPITKLCVDEKFLLRDVIAAWAKSTMQVAMLPPGVAATGVAGIETVELALSRSLADVRSLLPVRDGRPTISVKWPAIVQAAPTSAAKPAAQATPVKKAASKEKIVVAKNSNGSNAKEQRPNGTNGSKPPSNEKAADGKAQATQNGNAPVAKPAEDGKSAVSQATPAKKKDKGKKAKKADKLPATRPEKKEKPAKPVAKEGEDSAGEPAKKKRNTQGNGKENEVNGEKAQPAASSSSASGSDSSSSSADSDDEDMAAIEKYLADSPVHDDA